MVKSIFRKREGQSLVEILVAVAVGAIIVASAAAALVTSVRSNQVNRTTDTASSLAQELMDNVRSYGEANWQDLYAVTSKGDTTQPCTPYCYHLAAGGSPFTLTNSSEQLTVNNVVFTRYFTVENVNRDNCGTGTITTNVSTGCTGQSSDILEDPSTQKITVRVTWPQVGGSAGNLKVVGYVTHYTNQTSNFSDWSGGAGAEGPVAQPSSSYSSQSGLDTSTILGSITLSSDGSSPPTVTSPTHTAITSTGATLGANVTSNGGAVLTARGTCWATTANPVTNCVAEGGTTTGVFTHARTGMSSGTLIYYRGYATNSAGTAYSLDGSFTTSAGMPTLTSPTATSITSTGATLGANVTSNGGATLTARGTCWATTANPTTNCVAEGATTTGVFTHARTGMPSSTTIFYRGYATNSAGTAYSADGSFATASSAAASHFAAVNDSSADDDYVNYIYSFSATEQIDYYTLQNVIVPLPDRTSITVHIQGGGCLTSVSLRIGVNVITVPQAAGCNDLGDPNSIRPGRVHQETIGNPNGGSWTQTDLDNLEVGVGIKRAPDGSPGALARVWVESRAGEMLRPATDASPIGVEGVYYVSGDTYTGHWGKVDEPLADSASYVWTPSITEKRDTYSLTDPSVSGTINSVVVRIYNHGCNPRPSLKLGVNEIFDESGAGACDRPASRFNWAVHESPAMLKPGGGSWAWADLSNLQVGVGIRRDDVFDYNGEISAAYVIVTYNGSSYVILRPDGDAITNIESTVP